MKFLMATELISFPLIAVGNDNLNLPFHLSKSDKTPNISPRLSTVDPAVDNEFLVFRLILESGQTECIVPVDNQRNMIIWL